MTADRSTPLGPRFLYLHGFASGPGSHKGTSLSEHYEKCGVTLERLNLRVPSFEHLRLSAMVEATKAAIGGERGRAVLFGSSLGGLTACLVAEDDPRVSALVLLAPAFRIVERLQARLGEAAWRDWQETGWLTTEDYTTGRMGSIDFGFIADAEDLLSKRAWFPDVRVPVLIVHGTRDAVVDVELSREFARGRRHVRLVEVDDRHELSASLPRIVHESQRFLEPFLG